MDGGAYCTLTPVVLSPRRAPRRRPVPLPERPDPGPRRPNQHAAQRRVPRVRGAAGRVRDGDAPQPDRRAARHRAPLDIRRRNVYRTRATRPRPARSCARALPAEEVLERAVEASEFERIREVDRRPRPRLAGLRDAAAGRRAPDRSRARRRIGYRPGARLARRRLHRLGRGLASRSVASVELTADGRIRVLIGSTEMGQGTKTIFPRWSSGEALGVAGRVRRDRAVGHGVRARQRPHGRVPDGDGRRRPAASRRLGGCAPRSRPQRGGRSPRPISRTHAGRTAQPAIDQRFEPYPGISFDDATYRGDAYPAFGWAACVARSTWISTPARSTSGTSSRPTTSARCIHPILAEGQVEGGTLQAVGYATIEEIKLRRRPLPERPPRDVPHPDRARCPAHHRRSSSRRRSAGRRTAPRASASCRWTSARRRSSPPSTTRSACGSRTCRRRPERILAALAGGGHAPRPESSPRRERPSASWSTARPPRSTCSRDAAACSTSCARISR